MAATDVDSKVHYTQRKRLGLSAEEKNVTPSIKFDFNVHQELKYSIVCLYSIQGTPMWVLFHLGPIKNEKGEVMLFLVTLKDITEYKDPIVGTGNDIYFKLNRSLFTYVLNSHALWREILNSLFEKPCK